MAEASLVALVDLSGRELFKESWTIEVPRIKDNFLFERDEEDWRKPGEQVRLCLNNRESLLPIVLSFNFLF